MWRAARVLLVLAPLFGAARARADAPPSTTTRACIAASEEAQRARNAGRLRAATQALLACGDPACPSLVREACGQWMNEVRAATPTVVLGARDDAGHDVLDVRVTVDGVKVLDALDGKPLELDPGEHDVAFERAGRTVRERVLAREGEKDRAVTVTFPAPPAAPPPAPAPPAPPAPRAGPPAAAWIFGALSAAALGGALASDLAAFGDAGCKPRCTDGQASTVKLETYLAGGLAGLGVLSLGAAVWLFARPAHAAHAARSARGGPRVEVLPLRGGAGAALGASF